MIIPVKKNIREIILFPVRVYRLVISPWLPDSCRFAPTCSQYAIEAIEAHGVFRGLLLAFKRIIRCHPWGGSGFDPVPPRKDKTTGKGMVICIALLALVSCAPHKNSSKQILSVSIPPEKYFVEKITGDIYDINVVVPQGVNPEIFEPSPRNLQSLYASSVFFITGTFLFEKQLADKINASGSGVSVCDLSAGIELIGEHGHEMHDGDPHIWMSVANAKIMAANILKKLEEHNPADKDIFRKNYSAFITDLDNLEVKLHGMLDSIENRSFVIYHPALTYFARDFNLLQIPIEYEAKEPTVTHLMQVADVAKQNMARLVFIQKEFDKTRAETIANEINGSVYQINVLGYQWDNVIMYIAESIVGGNK